MLKIETIRYLLQGVQPSYIEKKTGISRAAVYILKTRENYSSYRVIAKLSEYFENQQKTALRIDEGDVTEEELKKILGVRKKRSP